MTTHTLTVQANGETQITQHVTKRDAYGALTWMAYQISGLGGDSGRLSLSGSDVGSWSIR